MTRLSAQQCDFNRQSQAAWDRFATHRQEVTRLLVSAAPTNDGRLCVLGAGNCNDLELSALTAVYRHVHLVDLDAAALQFGLAQQQPAQSQRIQLTGDRDLSGILPLLSRWDAAVPPADDEMQRAIDLALATPPPCQETFDTVASVCLLSQLIHSVAMVVSADHPRFADLMVAVRLRHLRMLAELTAPGGQCLLVTDLVSSDTCPSLATTPREQLPELVRRLLNQRNHFHGVHPGLVAQALHIDPQLAPLVRDFQFVAPWHWDLGPRMYLVYGIRFSLASIGDR